MGPGGGTAGAGCDRAGSPRCLCLQHWAGTRYALGISRDLRNLLVLTDPFSSSVWFDLHMGACVDDIIAQI